MLYQDLNTLPEILQAVERMGFTQMTEVQEKAIPVMQAGKDIIAKAPTGTGKTLCLWHPGDRKAGPFRRRPQAVILAPTRELATADRRGPAQPGPLSARAAGGGGLWRRSNGPAERSS